MKDESKNSALNYIAANLDKMLIPTLLFFLSQKPSHGYELIQKINESELCEVEADPATIYRNLRRMEEDGLVISKWETSQAGPARRAYELTAEGATALQYCAGLVTAKVKKLQTFLDQYNSGG
ncbi:PadR family transcriptional regulator [Desulforamulus ruminis]|uniref:Transcriptional regulator PadR family protein n=1 Tax=Desulforamulus ruminis (strain ATCC 23193 / DSM 2154 / NCIMB 8452 / DL) TaxID=696281 RepID=F6DSP5_DESRL|nr:PadR family transcriptional regulator [Desulforamulus ruminis]AEG58864.1 transcriptional regulator PadR family protein [Desulforamulus ruminis DSM 2154]